MTDNRSYSLQAIELGQLVEYLNDAKLNKTTTSVRVVPFITKELDLSHDIHKEWENVRTLYTKPYIGEKENAGAIFRNVANPTEYAYVFRGTKRLAEWLHNGRFFLDENGVHIGYNDLLNTSPDNFPLNYLPENWSKLLICGCSLGGALATLATLNTIKDLDLEKTKNIRLITFGSPHCVDSRNAQEISDKVFQWIPYERETDPVPSSLSKWVGGNFIKKEISLPSFGFSVWQYPLCHSMQFYHKGICDKENIEFKPLIKYESPFKFVSNFINP